MYSLNRNSLNFDLDFTKVFPKVVIGNKLALVPTMPWCQIGDMSLSVPIVAWFIDAYICHSAWMS